MQSPLTPAVVLEYQQRGTSRAVWPWLLLGAGAIPFAIEVVVMLIEGKTGDPPNNLREFKAYHYWTGAAVAIGIAWFVCTLFAFGRRYRWMLLIAGGWCLWVCWVAFWFLRTLHEHPAGAYYRSRW